MTGVEALLRWRHPELGLLGAGPLVTAARAARLERELTEHAHRIALTEIAAWPKPLAALPVSPNLNAAAMDRPCYAAWLTAMGKAAGETPSRLPVRLTEPDSRTTT